MTKRTYWLVFATIQFAGALLPLLAHSFKPLLYVGLFLLIPGALLASIAGTLSPFVFYPAVFLINAGVWAAVRKMVLPDTVP